MLKKCCIRHLKAYRYKRLLLACLETYFNRFQHTFNMFSTCYQHFRQLLKFFNVA